MYCQEYPASPLLNHVVQCYVIMGHDDPSGQSAPFWLPPGGFTTVNINIGPLCLDVDNAKYSQFNVPGIGHGSGQLTQPLKMSFGANSRLFSVKLQPHGFFQCFGIPGYELRDDYIPLECLSRLWTPDLIDQIVAAPTDQQRVAIMDRHLQRQLLPRQTRPDTIDYALLLINKQEGIVSLDKLTQQARICRRHLARLFEERVGLSPKFYARTVRFYNLSRRLWTGAPYNVQDLVQQYGFYDQSHLINEVRTFTSLSPTSAMEQTKLFYRSFNE